jgi:hypothetical protein
MRYSESVSGDETFMGEGGAAECGAVQCGNARRTSEVQTSGIKYCTIESPAAVATGAVLLDFRAEYLQWCHPRAPLWSQWYAA